MSHHTYAVVPAGMSYVNAFYALWEKAEPREMQLLDREAQGVEAAIPTSSERVAELFRNFDERRSPEYNMEYQGGRYIKVWFQDFPVLTVTDYDGYYGNGTAKNALEAYNRIPSSRRYDADDSHKYSDLPRACNKNESDMHLYLRIERLTQGERMSGDVIEPETTTPAETTAQRTRVYSYFMFAFQVAVGVLAVLGTKSLYQSVVPGDF